MTFQPPEALVPQSRSARLAEVARVFLRLGLTAFGGPAAHIALMENEIVRRRRWVSAARFLDLLGAANLIPGPSSTELAIFLGFEHAGRLGLIVGGACFILPAALLVALLAFAYVRFGAIPQLTGVLYGLKPVVIAIVVQALWGLAPRAIKKSPWLGALGVLACASSALGADALAVLLGSGLVSLAVHRYANREGAAHGLAPVALATAAASSAPAVAAPVSLAGLFLVFLKLGAVVFGSGYVLLAFLRADLVDRLHWLSEAQLLDAVAVGQVTPGPVFTTATFIGYVVGARGGPAMAMGGAALATLGIFLPGFVLVALTRPLLSRLRSSTIAGAFLDGVNVAALALMAVVTVQLSRAALVDAVTIGLAVAAGIALLRFQVNTTWIVVGGALVGALATR
jgi:chromate transporter